jgi:DNA-binding GntR family transcriptional regulator
VEEHHALAEAIRAGGAALVDRLLVAHLDDAIVRLSSR